MLQRRAGALAALLALATLPRWAAATGAQDLEGERCLEPIQPGPCRGSHRRWGYDPEKARCVLFHYGGCHGNSNRFKTRRECNRACRQWRLQDGGLSGDDPCYQRPDPGPCRARLPRWFYDAKAQRCRRFYYGGCRPNANNFFTKRACQAKCMPQEVCKLPPAAGPCQAYIPSFYWDPKKKECREFVYGGCKGNGNRFARIEDCEEACGE